MLLATLLGSCVSVCLSNPQRRISAMNHYLLPEAPDDRDVGRYGDSSIRRMVQTLFALEPDPRQYRARIYGGASVMGHLGALGDIGQRNIDVARRVLGELGLGISAEDVGGSRARRIEFNTQTEVIESRIVGVEDGKSNTRAAQGVRVLIVDDSPVARRVLRSNLQACEGIAVVAEAGDPFEARDLILSHDPDVLTLDIEMPGMDGVTFLRHLMKYLPKPVVVMSALAQAGGDVARRAREAGAFEVFDKSCLAPSDGGQAVRQLLAPALRRAARGLRGVA